MSQPYTPTQVQSEVLLQLQSENEDLKKYLAAQKVVIASLERRVGRSLDTLDIHLQSLMSQSLMSSDQDSLSGYAQLNAIQNEVNSLCDLISDTMLLQKLEAGKVEVKLEHLDINLVLASVSRHLLDPKDGSAVRLVREIDTPLPLALADQELTEAVLTDLLARGLKYSDATSPVVLGTEYHADRIYIRITAQRFAPAGNRDFATEIILCCRRIEVQRGNVTCQQHPDGLQTVTIALQVAP